MSENNDTWAVVDLMGHVTLAGRVTKPGEFGGLWQVDIPEGDAFRTEFFGSQSVYRIKIVSEEIARAYATPAHEIIAYDSPIVTREQHEQVVERARQEIYRAQQEISILRDRLVAVNALPAGEYPGFTREDIREDPDDMEGEESEI
jgi:DNA-directed RNA polymerase subunit K/omega